MRLRWRGCAAICLLAVILPGTPAGACDLTIGWEPWAPYQVSRDGAEGPEGLDIELVRHVAERADCAVTFRRMPWARLLKAIKRGDMDAAMAAAKNPERDAYAHFTKPYRNETVGLMVRAEDEAIQEKDSLRAIVEAGNTIGLWRDYYYGETVERLKQSANHAHGFRVMDQGRTLLRMLAAGRFDATLGDPVADTHTARKLGISDTVTIHGLTVLKTPVRLLLSAESVPRATVKRLNRAIAAAKDEGALRRIIDRYLAT